MSAQAEALGKLQHKLSNEWDRAAQRMTSDGQTVFYDEAGVMNIDKIKALLEEKADRDKLDGMKRTIAMISKGQDASPLFPYVVKNVITTNPEMKKLVHIFLVHYAELEPDNTLLAINAIQKDLNKPNQFVRASALRVLSSIRLKIILQIVLMAIAKAVKDISPYVRKTAAHAIAKVCDLEPSLKDELVGPLETLLADGSTMVLGSAIAVSQEVFPDDWSLIHPHFRKIVHVLPDIDEWGQVAALSMLLRYGRVHFLDPNRDDDDDDEKKKEGDGEEDGAAEGEEEEEEEEELEGWEGTDGAGAGSSAALDPDHRLLLTNSLPLLKSRNAAVVMGVSTLFYYLAPELEAQKCAKALTRIMRSSRETQYVVLANVATMATQRPAMFAPVVSEFFVKPFDPAYARALNLEIITHVVSSDTISKVLRELMSYVARHGDDSEFVTASIRAIGRCASQVPSVADRCLRGLMSLLGSRNPAVVAESLVVIKGLLQRIAHRQKAAADADAAAAAAAEAEAAAAAAAEAGDDGSGEAAAAAAAAKRKAEAAAAVAAATASTAAEAAGAEEDDGGWGAAINGFGADNDDGAGAGEGALQVNMSEAIQHVARLLDSVKDEQARASIVWVIGEYAHTVPRVAPDVFRQLAKSFSDEPADVKLQILNLGSKLVLGAEEASAAAKAELAAARAEEAAESGEEVGEDAAAEDDKRVAAAAAMVERIFHYVLKLARYDMSYDVRDRARLMRVILAPETGSANTTPAASSEGSGSDAGGASAAAAAQAAAPAAAPVRLLRAGAVRLFRTSKPVPTEASPSDSRLRFTLNTLSHTLSTTAAGYSPLPEFPTRQTLPDPALRDTYEQTRAGGAGAAAAAGGAENWNTLGEGEEWGEEGEEWEGEEGWAIDGEEWGDDGEEWDGEEWDGEEDDGEEWDGEEGDGEEEEEDLDAFFGGGDDDGAAAAAGAEEGGGDGDDDGDDDDLDAAFDF